MSIHIRPARADDAEAISAVILAALRETNARDYSRDIIERVEQSFGPAAVAELLARRTVFVAMAAGELVGTASLDGQVVRSVFVRPDLQGQGVGRRLMAEIEQAARNRGVEVLAVPSSVTAEAFYARLGFTAVRDSYHGEERTIVMERSLTDAQVRGGD